MRLLPQRDPPLPPGEESPRSDAELDALVETTLLLADGLDTPRLLEAIVDRAVALVGASDAFVYLAEANRETLTVHIGRGIFSERIGFQVGVGDGLAGRVARDGEPLSVPDYPSWEGRLDNFPYEFHAVVGVPLRGSTGVIGVLGVAHTSPHAGFDDRQTAMLDRFGRLAAIALDNARLLEQVQQELERRRRTEEELLDTVARLSRSELELRQAHAETIRRLADAAEFRDTETGRHTERMSRMCWQVARKLGIDEERCDLIRDASPLHDIGKIAIPDEVLLKPGLLTDEQRAVIERHPEVGYALLSGSSSEVLDLAATIALTHHERWDGKGYPHGIAGEAIPLEGRISAVADVFDALTTDRVYRPALTIDEAVRLMREDRGTRFDPLVLDALLAVVHEAQLNASVEQVFAPAQHDPRADAAVAEVLPSAAARRSKISDRDLKRACRAAKRSIGAAHSRDAIEVALEALCTPFGGRLLASVYAVEHERLWLVAQHGYSETRDGFSLEHGVMGRAARSGTIQLVADVTADPDFIAATGGIVSKAVIPYRDGGDVIAVLNVESIGAPLPSGASGTIAPLAGLLGARVADSRSRLGSDIGELVRLCVQASSLRGIGSIAELATRTVGRILGLASAQLDLWREADEEPRLVSFWRRDDVHLEPLSADALRSLDAASDAPTTASVVGARLASLRDDPSGAIVVLPLRAAGEMVGMIAGRVVGQQPTQDRLEAAMLFAQHTAALIDVATALRREQRAAVTDQLTGLLNRRGFEERFRAELQRAGHETGNVSILLCDCDGLKTINDLRGHEMGDALLELVASCLRTNKRATDVAARFGGDEFALLLPEADIETALAVAERIRSAIGDELIAGFRPSVSVGAASFPLHGGTTLEVLKAASDALSRAKQRGGDEVTSLQG